MKVYLCDLNHDLGLRTRVVPLGIATLACAIKDSFKEKILIIELIVKMKLATSKSESRKLIRGKGVKKNREIISNEMEEIKISNKISNHI